MMCGEYLLIVVMIVGFVVVVVVVIVVVVVEKETLQPLLTPLPLPTSQMPTPNIQKKKKLL